jgi:hypothetical protein
MKQDRQPSRKASHLPETLGRKLQMYAIAAGGAAVGSLALAAPAGAEVVYTPVQHPITRNSSYALDLNNDGRIDFYINETEGCSTFFCRTRLYAYVPFYKDRGNAVVGQGSFPFHAFALKAGSRIDPARRFGGSALFFRSRTRGVTSGPCTGSWVSATDRYLGLKFYINKEVHFGWARLSATCQTKSDRVGLLTGYAYETVANMPILAGQTSGQAEARLAHPDAAAPASLGLLALGSRGLAAWRRDDLAAVGSQN